VGVLAGIIFCLAGTAFAAVPPDVEGHWAERRIAGWLERDLASGYPDGTFRPENHITRAEFMILANKAFGFTAGAGVHFSDVSPTDWFYQEVGRAVAVGYISGYRDGTVRPGFKISRQEAAAILFRLLDLQAADGSPGARRGFEDAGDVPEWSGRFIDAVVAGGYMNGYPDGTFRPAAPITRAEAIAVLDRAAGISEAAGVTATAAGEVISASSAGGGTGAAGGAGGSADTVPPRVTAATITAGGAERSIVITDGGRSGEIDLSGLDPATEVTAGSITVSEAATMVTTIRVGSFEHDLEQDLVPGCNQLDVINLFQSLLGREATLGILKSLLGNPVDLGGVLTDRGGNTAGVSLLVRLP